MSSADSEIRSCSRDSSCCSVRVVSKSRELYRTTTRAFFVVRVVRWGNSEASGCCLFLENGHQCLEPLTDEAVGMKPVNPAFDSASERATPQSHIGYTTSSSIKRPSLAQSWSTIDRLYRLCMCICNSGLLQSGVFWTNSDKPAGGPNDGDDMTS